MRITDEQVEFYLEHGYLIVEDFLGADELQAARENFHHYYPTWEEFAKAAPERYPHLQRFGHASELDGFFLGDGLNTVVTHPDIVDFMVRVIGTSDIVLEQSHLMAKYAGTGDFDQKYHLDFGDHTLTYPRDDGTYRIIPVIAYYTDVTEELGPTGVVSQMLTKGEIPNFATWGLRTERVELYDAQVKVIAPAGSILLYGMQTWHRGTPFLTDTGCRFAHFFGYRAREHAWQGNNGWPGQGPRKEMQDFLTRASVRQRELLGFPSSGHDFWNEETLKGTGERYPDMDMTPYRSAA